MKIVLLCILCLYFIACGSSNSVSTQDLVKKYMTDSIVPKFNDPSSYQFVSMQADTFRGSDYITNLKTLYTDTILFTPQQLVDKQKEASELSARPGYQDSIIDLEIEVAYRGKNKLGALILDKLNLRYYPVENRIIPK